MKSIQSRTSYKLQCQGSVTQAMRVGIITFIGIVGVLGTLLMYAPDNVLSALYQAGAACAVVAAIGNLANNRKLQ